MFPFALNDRRVTQGNCCSNQILLGSTTIGNYPPPCQRGKLRQISYIAECRNFESNGEPEFVLSMFGLRLVTFQKRRAKRLRDSPYHWHLGDNYFQRSRGSILA